MSNTVSFGDDLVDIAMLRKSGRGVAVANANPNVLNIADEICPSNNDDGVAQWIEDNLLWCLVIFKSYMSWTSWIELLSQKDAK